MLSILHFVLTIGFIASCNGQDFLQRLKYLPRGVAESTVVDPQFPGVYNNDTGNKFEKADRICVYGIWALYSTTNFGVGQETVTTVITVVGKNPTTLECSSSGQISGLNRVKSVKYFGNRNANESGISIVSDAYLLGGRWEPLSETPFVDDNATDISAVRIGSIAITGNRPYQICSDKDTKYCICVDPSLSRYSALGGGAGLFLNRDTVRDTASRWLLTAQNLDNTIDRPTCASMNNPNYPRALWRAELEDPEKTSSLEFHEYNPNTNSNSYSEDDTPSTDNRNPIVVP